MTKKPKKNFNKTKIQISKIQIGKISKCTIKFKSNPISYKLRARSVTDFKRRKTSLESYKALLWFLVSQVSPLWRSIQESSTTKFINSFFTIINCMEIFVLFEKIGCHQVFVKFKPSIFFETSMKSRKMFGKTFKVFFSSVSRVLNTIVSIIYCFRKVFMLFKSLKALMSIFIQKNPNLKSSNVFGSKTFLFLKVLKFSNYFPKASSLFEKFSWILKTFRDFWSFKPRPNVTKRKNKELN